jgi:hypothetical protein
MCMILLLETNPIFKFRESLEGEELDKRRSRVGIISEQVHMHMHADPEPPYFV